MRRRKRVLFIVFTVFCVAVFYGYHRGRQASSDEVNSPERVVLGRKIGIDKFDETPFSYKSKQSHVAGLDNQVLEAIPKPGVVNIADQNIRNDGRISNNGIDSNVKLSNTDNIGMNRKKFPEPISLKPQVPIPNKLETHNQRQREGGRAENLLNKADVVQFQGQQGGILNGAKVQAPENNHVHVVKDLNAAAPGFVPPQNAAEPPGQREDKTRLLKLQKDLEERQKEVKRQQLLLKEQDNQMKELQVQQQQQNERWKKQQEEQQKQLELMRQQQEQHIKHQQQMQQQQQQQQFPQQPPQFQPQPGQPQFQPQPGQFQPQQPQFQPQQPQFQPQQPQFQPQQPQFQPRPAQNLPPQPVPFQPQQHQQQNMPAPLQVNQQAVQVNQQQQPAVNLAVQGNQGVPPMNQGGQQSGGDYLKNLLKDKIHLSVVCCGDRLEETTVMLKSAVVFTQTPMHFHIFAEDQLQEDMANKLNSWSPTFRKKFSFNIYPITFPPGENPAEWKKVFKLCATQRLFLPDLLKNVDSVLYVDTDILFMRPLEKIWSFFAKFNKTQFAAMTPEHEIANIGWYNRFGRHPFYGMTGLNSGVMLMNLTRMRRFSWTDKIIPLYREYKTKITWGDQDLINILFHFHPECVYVYPCEWNFRPDACMYSLNCHRITTEGVAVIHGNRGVYHNDKQLSFRAIYDAFHSYEFGTDLETALIQGIRQRFSNPNLINMYCTKALSTPLMTTLQESINEVKSKLLSNNNAQLMNKS